MDRVHWANHLPLLVLPTANIGSIDGFAPPFPLQHSIEPSWLDNADSLDEYTGFAVQGSEIRLHDSIRGSAERRKGAGTRVQTDYSL